MADGDLIAAVRLIERINEIVALVESWPAERINDAGIVYMRKCTPDDLERFDELDARVGGLMNKLGIGFPQPALWECRGIPLRGYTELSVIRLRTADLPNLWGDRLRSVKHAVHEIVDVRSTPRELIFDHDKDIDEHSVYMESLVSSLGVKDLGGQSIQQDGATISRADVARILGISSKTLANRAKSLPMPVERTSRGIPLYRYSELRPAIIKLYPDKTFLFPECGPPRNP